MIQLIKCSTIETIDEGLRQLILEFDEKHTYYKEWCKEIRCEVLSGKRKIYSLVNENAEIVGYEMLNFFYEYKSVKLNAIYIDKKYRKHGYSEQAFLETFKILNGYNYMFIQTRFYNDIVLHLFEKFGFYVIGIKYHEIEKMKNVVAVYDLKLSKNTKEMLKYAEIIYNGFKRLI